MKEIFQKYAILATGITLSYSVVTLAMGHRAGGKSHVMQIISSAHCLSQCHDNVANVAASKCIFKFPDISNASEISG